MVYIGEIKKNRIVIVILLCLFLCGCKSTDMQSAKGLYVHYSTGGGDFKYVSLELLEDSCYKCVDRTKMSLGTACGKWCLIGDTIHLNPEKSYYFVTKCDSCDKNIINVYNSETDNKEILMGILIYYCDSIQEHFLLTDTNGTVSFPSIPFDSIVVNAAVWDYYNVTILPCEGANIIDVYLVKTLYGYDNSVWTINATGKITETKLLKYNNKNYKYKYKFYKTDSVPVKYKFSNLGSL